MEQKTLENAALRLHKARLNKASIPQLSKEGLNLSRTEAYQVQEIGISLREKQSERRIGLKMGLTSEGKRRQMNLDSPLYGELTQKMQIENGAHLSISSLIHPKIEPEIAFLIAKPLQGHITREQVLNSCEAIASSMEILDSRYEQFKYFSMEDVIADNSSSSHFIVGPWVKDFSQIDLRELKMKMSVDEIIVQEGLSKEISGDPINSVIELCRLLALRGRKLDAGMIVLAGAATAAVELKPGQKIILQVDAMPPTSVTIS